MFCPFLTLKLKNTQSWRPLSAGGAGGYDDEDSDAVSGADGYDGDDDDDCGAVGGALSAETARCNEP